MSEDIYLPRELQNTEKTFSESHVLQSKLVIILAEPGAGKSALLSSLAKQLNTNCITANVAQYSLALLANSPLVIDALDELAKIDKSGVSQLLGKLTNLCPTTLILSSRASEWEESYTKQCESFFGVKPLVVHIQPFSEEEQARLFNSYYPNKEFTQFQQEISKFELNELLPNPQFLKMFADAFVESGESFSNKDEVFALSIQGACRESNPSVSSSNTLPLETKQTLAEELFAKLLLSGCEGVSISDGNAEQLYPYIHAIMRNHVRISEILPTKLFKPSDKSDHHQPVHRIIAEYCVGKYLAKRVNSTDKRISLNMLLAIIAPNKMVRDELRGLIGWFATFADERTQHKLIELDPYAVMANGNPSSLTPSSKKFLLQQLVKVSQADPYFNRGDYWRDLYVDGLLTEDNIEEIRTIICDATNERLQQLLLKLLKNLKISSLLLSDLENIALDNSIESYTRKLAYQCLLKVSNDTSHLTPLIKESSATSLFMVAEFLIKKGATITQNDLLDYLKQCLCLYPKSHKQEHRRRTHWQDKFFMHALIDSFEEQATIFLLDKLTENLQCTCDKKSYECECRYAISKLVGRLLDRYFDLTNSPYNPEQIWNWVKNLYFHGTPKEEDCSSLRELRKNDRLRQGIIKLVFENETDEDRMRELKHYKFHWEVHSGLSFHPKDHKYILNLAFHNNNPSLWSCFTPPHPLYNPPKEPDYLRQLARKQANEKPEFMRIWAPKNREAKAFRKSDDFGYRRPRWERRYNKQERDIKEKNLSYFRQNRALIERGEHWSVLAKASYYYLNEPVRIEELFCDRQLVDKALENCQHFIQPHIPSLAELSQAKIDSKTYEVERILFASCLRIFRKQGCLDGIPTDSLTVLRTYQIHCNEVESEEKERLEVEIDRIILPTTAEVEVFLRNYIEPMLKIDNCQKVPYYWLESEATFVPLMPQLSHEWLETYPNLHCDTVKSFFDILAKKSNKKDLKALIIKQCEYYQQNYPKKADDDIESKRLFWYTRAFYYLESGYETYWDWLKKDKNNITIFQNLSGRWMHQDASHFPTLTAEKIELLLSTFIEKWQKVDLPSSWGTGDPIEETAYRFLTEIIWKIGDDAPKKALPVISRLMQDNQFKEFTEGLKGMKASLLRKNALAHFAPPSATEVTEFFDKNQVATVESMRALIIDELQRYQDDLDGGELTSKDDFYEADKHIREVPAVRKIAERLRLRLERLGITTPEHHLKDDKRCDITFAIQLNGRRKLVTIEAKGQWHKELFTATEHQLHERYSIHPDAEGQGIYLVLWFGKDEKVAGKKHIFQTANELKQAIEDTIPEQYKGVTDVFVLDLSK